MLVHFFGVREMLRLPQQTVRPDRTPNLPVRGRGPVPALHPGRAIVGYRRARNAATRRAHAHRRRRYCEYLFRRHQVSLHYWLSVCGFILH